MKWGAVIGSVALAALTSLPARAADMTPVVQRPATSGYIPAQFFWTGFYLGAGIGGGWGHSTFVDPFGSIASPSLKGFLLGGVAGINYQINSIVVGVEGDFVGSLAKGTTIDPLGNALQTQVLWTATITGRLGWAFDRLLIYGKGGAAFEYDRDTVTQPSAVAVVGSTTRGGWTVGAGAEYAFTEHWTTRLEYDYLRFPSKGSVFSGPGPLNSAGSVGISLNELKLTVANKF
jgi:outer membrane immunogenic protein